MFELLASFSIAQIIICVGGIILAIKGAWDLIDYFKSKYNEKFNKDYTRLKEKELLQEHYVTCKKQHEETMEQYGTLTGKIDEVIDSMDELNHRVDALTESDMHDIKQSIVKSYHYFTEQKKWIDDFNLECLELRYKDYLNEGGNSYIEGLMKEIRQLPKSPPEQK